MNRAAIIDRLDGILVSPDSELRFEIETLLTEVETAPKTLSERIAAYFAQRRKRAYNRAEDRRVEAEIKRAAELAEKARSEFKIVGTMSTPVTMFGRNAGVEFVYFYENAKGERKVKATDDQLLQLPGVVYFLAGKPLDAIQKMVNDKSIAA